MKQKIVISAEASISALGSNAKSIESCLRSGNSMLQRNSRGDWVGKLALDSETELQQLLAQNPKYKLLDRSALLAIYASQQAWRARSAKGKLPLDRGGVNIGSSRGATGIMEERLEEYLPKKQNIPNVHTSPVTTLGAVSSWVGRALNLNGPAFSHSVTCSTSLYAIGNAMAWIQSGMSDYFIAGGSEAPLTEFTIDQMKALKIYSRRNAEYPSLPLGHKNQGENTMVLGEGAGSFVIEKEEDALEAGITDYTTIEGVGFANEDIQSPTSISADGMALQSAMQRALEEAGHPKIDLVIAHAPGTYKGDEAEIKAVSAVFGKNTPAMTSSKWQTGHLLGASSALAIHQAILLLKMQVCPPLPYENAALPVNLPIQNVMVNSIGFGGNAASIILSRSIKF